MHKPIDPFSPPTIEAALSMIERYARDNKMTPADLVDLFNTGIAVRQIAMGAITQRPARRPDPYMHSLVESWVNQISSEELHQRKKTLDELRRRRA